MLADTSVNLVVDLETSLGVFRQGRLLVQVTWGVAARKYLDYVGFAAGNNLADGAEAATAEVPLQSGQPLHVE